MNNLLLQLTTGLLILLIIIIKFAMGSPLFGPFPFRSPLESRDPRVDGNHPQHLTISIQLPPPPRTIFQSLITKMRQPALSPSSFFLNLMRRPSFQPQPQPPQIQQEQPSLSAHDNHSESTMTPIEVSYHAETEIVPQNFSSKSLQNETLEPGVIQNPKSNPYALEIPTSGIVSRIPMSNMSRSAAPVPPKSPFASLPIGMSRGNNPPQPGLGPPRHRRTRSTGAETGRTRYYHKFQTTSSLKSGENYEQDNTENIYDNGNDEDESQSILSSVDPCPVLQILCYENPSNYCPGYKYYCGQQGAASPSASIVEKFVQCILDKMSGTTHSRMHLKLNCPFKT